MTNEKPYSIGEMARRTGLSIRALRHYEDEGLLRPARSGAGRRVYAVEDVLALTRITLLKRAGFSIAQIRALLAKGAPDAAALVDAQAEALTVQLERLAASLDVLEHVRRRLKSGQPADAKTLCQLIKSGQTAMEIDDWKKIYDRYYTPEEQREWAAAKKNMDAEFDYEAYNQAWADVAARIEKALPLDPASAKAQEFLAEWTKLLEPLAKIATPEMMEGASRFWRNIDDWHGEVEQPVSPRVVKFITAVKAAAKSR